MKKIIKALTLRLVSVVIVAVFLVNATAYAIDRPYKNTLRVPMAGNSREPIERLERTQRELHYRELCERIEVKYIGFTKGEYFPDMVTFEWKDHS